MPAVPIQPVNAEESHEQIQPLINVRQVIDFLEMEQDTAEIHQPVFQEVQVAFQVLNLILESRCEYG